MKAALNNHQQGFTLIELLMALAITAIIAVVLATTLSQTVSISQAGHKHMEAVKQVENALYYINRDVQTAASISTSGNWLTITRPDGDIVSYTIVTPSDGSPPYFRRSQDGSSLTVARYIDTSAGLTRCSYTDGRLTLKITASLPGLGAASETRDLVIYPRLNQASQ